MRTSSAPQAPFSTPIGQLSASVRPSRGSRPPARQFPPSSLRGEGLEFTPRRRRLSRPRRPGDWPSAPAPSHGGVVPAGPTVGGAGVEQLLRGCRVGKADAQSLGALQGEVEVLLVQLEAEAGLEGALADRKSVV